jgi:hypothetical protein
MAGPTRQRRKGDEGALLSGVGEGAEAVAALLGRPTRGHALCSLGLLGRPVAVVTRWSRPAGGVG